MANEITFSGSLSVYKPSVMGQSIGLSVSSLVASMSGTTYVGPTNVLIGTSATAFPLGGVTAPHWCGFYNTDTVNYVTIRNGSGGADLVKLLAGEYAFFPMYDSAVPYGVANTAACLVEYVIFSL